MTTRSRRSHRRLLTHKLWPSIPLIIPHRQPISLALSLSPRPLLRRPPPPRPPVLSLNRLTIRPPPHASPLNAERHLRALRPRMFLIRVADAERRCVGRCFSFGCYAR